MLGLVSNGSRLQRQTLVDSVYQQVLDAIVSGRIAAGTELNEVALARELGVSRTPVHEALAWLAADDLVEQNASRASVRKLTAAEVKDLYEVRELLECSAAARATSQLPASRLKALQAEARALAEEVDDPEWAGRAIDYDGRFHESLAAASGNERLHREIGRYRLLVRAFCRLTGSNRKNLRNSVTEHLKILKALEKRDACAASQAMSDHIRKRLQAVLEEVYGAETAE
jgi:DNA-binding GntR family transcriptional regulator